MKYVFLFTGKNKLIMKVSLLCDKTRYAMQTKEQKKMSD